MAISLLIAQRLAAVEAAVSELQRCLANLPQAPDWLEEITGSFKDEPAFEEVLAFGRALLARISGLKTLKSPCDLFEGTRALSTL